MSRGKISMDLLTEKMATLVILLFVLFISHASVKTQRNTHHAFTTTASVWNSEVTAVKPAALFLPVAEFVQAACRIPDFNEGISPFAKVRFSGMAGNTLYKRTQEKFILIKPLLPRQGKYAVRNFLPPKKDPLIS